MAFLCPPLVVLACLALGTACKPLHDAGTPQGGQDGGPGGPRDAGLDAGASPHHDAGAPVPALCVGEDEPIYDPYTQAGERICATPDRLPISSRGVVVDLSEVAAGDAGTCGPFGESGSTLALDASLGFPQWIRLPAVSAPDPACTGLCDALVPPPTSFGIAFEYPGFYPGGSGQLLVVRAPSPWFFVAQNEHEQTPCMNGAPSILEFGKALACVTTGVAHFGLSTSDMSAPSVDVLVDLVPIASLPNTPGCCPYLCAE